MTLPVYSTELAYLASSAFGETSLGGPDGSVRWIVNDISCFFLGGYTVPLQGFSVKQAFEAVIFAMAPPFAVQGFPYHWSGRQVVESPNSLVFFSTDAGWSVRVSGYVLTLP